MERKKIELGNIFATIAFALILATCTSFNVFVLLILVAMFAIAFIRKEEQTTLVSLLEAVYLELLLAIVNLLVVFFQSVIGQIIVWAEGNRFGAFADVFGVIYFLVTVAFALIAIMSLVKSLKGRPTKTLIVANIAAKSLGIFIPKPVYYAQQPVAPGQQTWTCECGNTNTGAFCSNCGKPKA